MPTTFIAYIVMTQSTIQSTLDVHREMPSEIPWGHLKVGKCPEVCSNSEWITASLNITLFKKTEKQSHLTEGKESWLVFCTLIIGNDSDRV